MVHNVRTPVLVVALLAAPASVFAQVVADSCGGGCPILPRNARVVSIASAPAAPYPGPAISATLRAGRRKRILYAETMTTESTGLGGPYVYVTANGLPMRPVGGFPVDYVCPSTPCAVAAWLDMDDPANAALIGVPITVTLSAWNSLPGGTFDMSLVVRLEKK